ncbi:uncharacterized protein N7496_001612 [Penicillium cataractarum]|uniref:Uncharacterized protein n=1 Tax=Penicillium cataractarum TaxID=2100454 RepID=A0A9X0B721_9EURO|nr:uncharacterized protein N7496_001612 [Penicillium cataractarum]KAJ5390544.1 hypothetical protein N7496_001612 [Penicillium cataractarum]
MASQEDRDVLISEDYGHVPKPSIATYERICAHYAEVSQSSPEAVLPALYSLDILHGFLFFTKVASKFEARRGFFTSLSLPLEASILDFQAGIPYFLTW